MGIATATATATATAMGIRIELAHYRLNGSFVVLKVLILSFSQCELKAVCSPEARGHVSGIGGIVGAKGKGREFNPRWLSLCQFAIVSLVRRLAS